MNILDNFRTFFIFNSFVVRCSIDVLDQQIQPGSVFGKIRTGSEAQGLTEYVLYHKYFNLQGISIFLAEEIFISGSELHKLQ